MDLKIENGWSGIIQSRPLRIEIVKPKAKNTIGKKASGLRPVSEAARKRALNHCNAADNLQSKKQYDAAIAEYGKAIEIDPLCTRAYFGRSSLFASHKKDYRAAVRDLTQMLQIKPEDFSARYNRGLYRESLRKYDDAIRDYTALFDEDVDFSHLVGPKTKYLALAHHYRGRAYQWYKKEYAKAAADFTKALEYDPNLRMLHYRRGQCYHELGKYKESMADFDAALKKQPKYPNLLLSYAWLLATCPDAKYRSGRKAVQLAEQVAPLSRARSSRLLDVLAAAYAESGQFKQAVAASKKALVNFNQKYGTPRKEIEARLKLYRAGKPFRLKARSGKHTRIDK